MTETSSRPPYASPRAVQVLLGAAAVTYVGDEVAAIALALAVHATGAGGLVVASLFLAKMLPLVVLAPWSGALVDRLGPARTLSAASVVAASVVACLCLTSSTSLWIAGTALVAATTAVAQPALLTLLPQAAGPGAARRAMSWAAVASRSSAASGALLAGVLVATGGLRLALLVDALTYLAVVLGVRLVRRDLPAFVPAVAEQVQGRPALAGLRLITTDPVLRVVVGVLVAAITFVGISYVAVFFFVSDVLQGGTAGTTAVVAAYGAGMTVGCWIAGRLPVHTLATTAVRAPLVMGAGFLLPVVLPSVALAVVGFAAAGLASGTALTALRGLVLERVPSALLGRVWAAESALGVSGELLALATAGVVVTVLGPTAAMALCGGGALAAGVLGVLSLPRLVEPVLPDVPVQAVPAATSATVPRPRAAADTEIAAHTVF